MIRITKFFQWRTKSVTTLLCGLALFGIVTVLGPNIANAESFDEINSRVVQVVLEEHPKISQYTDIDASADGLGKNACGFVAAAAALGGEDWTPLVDELASAAGMDYNPDAGIQPSKYVTALQKVFGSENVEEKNSSSLSELYQQLAAGNIVIVDLKVNANLEAPSATPPTYAHFARVLGMDMTRQEVYIENTLYGAPYWTVSFATFDQVWQSPEISSTLIPDPQHAEPVTRWMVLLNPTSDAY
ncbi:MAG TPA: C39 family peptidase [Anaerolineae bacterium]|nr:C39 family peptidase [Anaerolineae bacterium]